MTFEVYSLHDYKTADAVLAARQPEDDIQMVRNMPELRAHTVDLGMVRFAELPRMDEFVQVLVVRSVVGVVADVDSRTGHLMGYCAAAHELY